MPLIEPATRIDFAANLLGGAGMEADKAAVTAAVPVEGDMIGMTPTARG